MNVPPLFKRDLRLRDRPALSFAAGLGQFMPVNIVEPEFWTHRDASARQWEFGAESLTDLREALADQGLPLDIRIDEAVEVRDRPCRRYRIGQIVSQEETGTRVPSRTARVDTSRRRSMPDL